MKKAYESLDLKKKKEEEEEKREEIKKKKSEVIGLHATEVQIKNKKEKRKRRVIHLPRCPLLLDKGRCRWEMLNTSVNVRVIGEDWVKKWIVVFVLAFMFYHTDYFFKCVWLWMLSTYVRMGSLSG